MSVQGCHSPLVCFLDFMAEVGRVGDQVLGDTTTVDVQTGLFEHVPGFCLFQ
jgi:hypothetical protein